MEKQMKKLSTILGALSLGLLASTAYAGYGHEGKAYTKLDMGYGIQDSKQTLTRGLTAAGKDSGDGIVLSAGLGYYFMDELRVDLMAYYDRGMKSKTSTKSGATNVAIRGKEQSFGAFANAYYDVLNQSNVTPYIMGGAGFLRNEFKSEIVTTATGKQNKNKFAIAYQGGAGVSYHLSSSFDIDFGYRYIMKGSEEYKFTITNLNTDVKAKTSPVHAGIIGLKSTF